MKDHNVLTAMLGLACAMGGGGNIGNAVPIDNVDDLSKGATYIPGEVTLARREGKHVIYCGNNKWLMPDGKEIS